MGLFPFTDLHSHLIPSVDDGAPDAARARSALTVLTADGVGRVVATPHVKASVLADPVLRARRLGELEMGWRLLVQVAGTLGREAPALARGAEILLDAPELDLSDPVLRLAGGPAVLVEFPAFRVPRGADGQLARLAEAGWNPVVAHAERYEGAERFLDEVLAWRESGAVVQVNAGSFLGRYGAEARGRAWELLEAGCASLVASDYHARAEPPGLGQAHALLTEGTALAQGGPDGGRRRPAHGGESAAAVRAAAQVLFGTNPRRLLEGRPVLPVPPLVRRRGSWRRWLGSTR